MGAAAFPADGWTPEALIAVADEHMYRDKLQRKSGRSPAAGRDAA
jgi:hypothetical protein